MATKTIKEQLLALYETRDKTAAKIVQLEAAQAAQEQLESIGPGSIIRFVFGRKETRGEFSGEVRSVIDTEKGKVIRVIKGEGADEEIVSIKPADVLAVGEEVREAVAEEQSKGIPLGGEVMTNFGPMGVASSDPLASLI